VCVDLCPFQVLFRQSLLKDSTDIKYLEEVYRFRDRIHDYLGDIMYDVAKNAVKEHSLDLEYLIIDATRIKVWKDEQTNTIRFGYCSKNDRKGLPQINFIMGVNTQQIPLFVNMYPGNTQDVKMFDDFVHRINTNYKELTQEVEEGFRALKSDLDVNPVFHSKDMRIETHAVLVVFGYFLLSLLRVIISERGVKHSFVELKEIIKSGNAMVGFYEHEQLKNKLYLWRPIKPREELEKIFRALKIETPQFDVKECIPTNSEVF